MSQLTREWALEPESGRVKEYKPRKVLSVMSDTKRGDVICMPYDFDYVFAQVGSELTEGDRLVSLCVDGRFRHRSEDMRVMRATTPVRALRLVLK